MVSLCYREESRVMRMGCWELLGNLVIMGWIGLEREEF